MAATDARPVPLKNTAFRLYAEIRDNTGALVTGGLTGMDSERSLDGAAFADCTNEFTEIGTSGIGYLDLTTTEMNTDSTVVKITVTNTDAKPTTHYLYPEETGDINVDVTAAGGSALSTSTAQFGVNVVNFGGSAGTFASGRPEVNASHWAGTAVGSTTVRSDLINIAGAAVSASTAQLGVNVVNVGGSAVSASSGLLNANVTQISGDALAADTLEALLDGTGGTLTGTIVGVLSTCTNVTTVNGLAAGVITATSIASDAITAAKVADGAIDAATFAAGAINASAIASGAITAAKFAAGAIDASAIADGAIDAGAIASDAITAAKIADGAIDTATFASGATIPRVTLADTVTTYTGNTPQTGDSYAIVNSGVHGNAAIKGYVDDIGTAGAGLTGIPWNASWDAEVQSEVQDAIEANNLHRLIATTGTVSNPGGGTSTVFNTNLSAADDAYNDQVLIVTSGALVGQTRVILDYAQTNGQITLSEALTAAPSNGVTFALLATHVHTVSQIQSGLSTHSASDVWAVATRVLTAGTNIALAKGTGVTGFTDLSAADVRTAVGLASANLDTQLADIPTVAEFEARTVVAANYATASALDTVDNFLDTEIAAIKAKTDNLPTDPADASDVAGSFALAIAQLGTISGYIDSEVAAIKTKTDQLTFSTANRLDVQVYGMEAGTVTAAAIATGAIDADALAADVITDIWQGSTLTEAYAADGAAFTPAQALYMIYSAVMEFSISSTTMTCKKLDGSTTAMTVTLNDASNPTSRTRSG